VTYFSLPEVETKVVEVTLAYSISYSIYIVNPVDPIKVEPEDVDPYGRRKIEWWTDIVVSGSSSSSN
jgi:hypothetical protein